MGVDFAVGVTASLLERVTMMVVYIGLGLLFALPVWLRYAEKGQACQKGIAAVYYAGAILRYIVYFYINFTCYSQKNEAVYALAAAPRAGAGNA